MKELRVGMLIAVQDGTFAKLGKVFAIQFNTAIHNRCQLDGSRESCTQAKVAETIQISREYCWDNFYPRHYTIRI